MNERTNELRKKRRNENYKKLRKFGYTAKQATCLKNLSRKTVSRLVTEHELREIGPL